MLIKFIFLAFLVNLIKCRLDESSSVSSILDNSISSDKSNKESNNTVSIGNTANKTLDSIDIPELNSIDSNSSNNTKLVLFKNGNY